MFLFKIFRILNFIFKHPLNKNQKIKALIRFLKWQIGSRLVPGEVIYHWINDSRFIVRPGETGLTQNIYCGLQEFHEMAYVLHVLNSEDLFIDIGANVGAYTILACAVKGARGYSFEPIPSTFNGLVNNIKINDLQNRVTAYNIGLADKESEILFTAGLNSKNHMVADNEIATDVIKVKIRPLDSVLAGEFPTLIKIDVEGLETLVINGMQYTLENRSLHSVVMELNGSGVRYGFNDAPIIQKMLDYGFRMYSYEPFSRTLKQTSQINSHSGNVIFMRNENFVNQRVISAPRVKIGSYEV